MKAKVRALYLKALFVILVLASIIAAGGGDVKWT